MQGIWTLSPPLPSLSCPDAGGGLVGKAGREGMFKCLLFPIPLTMTPPLVGGCCMRLYLAGQTLSGEPLALLLSELSVLPGTNCASVRFWHPQAPLGQASNLTGHCHYQHKPQVASGNWRWDLPHQIVGSVGREHPKAGDLHPT